MSADLSPAAAAARLRGGGVIAYPTEGVWGLGCDPASPEAVSRLLRIKQRAVEKGLILIAASLGQLRAWIDPDALPAERWESVIASWPGPCTWVLPAAATAPEWITGAHSSIAVRISAHPEVVALCRAFEGALVSTSANLSGADPARSRDRLDPALLALIDGVLAGETGGLLRPTPIRDARSGETFRS